VGDAVEVDVEVAAVSEAAHERRVVAVRSVPAFPDAPDDVLMTPP
jgi:hypothetical protein